MCGIVGYTGNKDIQSVILVGLERLEYRGYDSCGIAIITEEHKIKIEKVVGRLQNLMGRLDGKGVTGNAGIGHTRWATHGEVTEENAHPFTDCTQRFAIVHNGIIENYREIKERLLKKGHRFKSDTDSEVVVHLLEDHYKGDFLKAVIKTVKELEGSFAAVFISTEHPKRIVGVKKGSPLIIGIGRKEYALASDPLALVGVCKRMIVMEDGEVCDLEQGNPVKIYTFDGKKKEAKIQPIQIKDIAVTKKRYPNFMRKEIMEQPEVLEENIRLRIKNGRFFLGQGIKLSPEDLKRIERIIIEACGTSYHAGLVGRYYIENFAGIHTEVEIASEYFTRGPIFNNYDLLIAISQSGETADTLNAIRSIKKETNIPLLGIVNVKRSSLDRESDSVLYINAGPEIGVASTKAYTAQIFALLIFSLYLAKIKQRLSSSLYLEVKKELLQLPDKMRKVIKTDKRIKEIAKEFKDANHFLFLGRGINYPSALEGALKLKEISYIHATGYPAGEMKHGPISLVDENTPVVVIAPRDSTYTKIISNLKEVKARGGKVIAIGDEDDAMLRKEAYRFIPIPKTPEYLSSMIIALPLQLLAYHTAILRGCDVDKPRNLAKSVTVE